MRLIIHFLDVENIEDEIAYWKTIPKSQSIQNILVPFAKEYR
jgi:hypothetical protein